MTVKVLRLKDFLENFVDEHARTEGDEVLLDVTPEEVEELGNFFVRGMCGWMRGLKNLRQQQSRDLEVAESDNRSSEENDLLN